MEMPSCIVHKFHSFSSHFVPVHLKVAFVTVGKDRYQLEIPESVQKKVPRDYEVMSSRKVYSWTTNHFYFPADHSFSINDCTFFPFVAVIKYVMLSESL